jgi:integrase
VAQNKLAKGEGSVYFRSSDQKWCGTLTLPSPDGKRRRKTVTAATEQQARTKLAGMRKKLLIEGDLPTTTQTFGSWLNYWYTTIALKKIRPKTAATYRSLLQQYIIPTVGAVQLQKLTPAHIRLVEETIVKTPKNPKDPSKGMLSSTTAAQCYRIMVVALEYAVRENRVTRNVAKLTDAPVKAPATLTILTRADGLKVLRMVTGDPENGLPADRLASRWWAAFLTGARQGELLGLELDRVGDDLDLSWQLQRLSWEHGCGEHAVKGWPCSSKRAAECPDRKITFPANWENRHLTGGLWLSRPKTEAGTRIIPLVDALRASIEMRVEAARSEPNPHGLLWTSEPKQNKRGVVQPLDGSPIDPSDDNAAWHEILKRAGVADARLHDARHTTASLLLEAKVPEAIIMKIMGHNSFAVTRGYQWVDRELKADAMSRTSALMQ